MATFTLQTPQEFTAKIVQLEQLLQQHQERKAFLEAAVEAQKKLGQILTALVSPLNRRQMTLEVLRLRQEIRQTDLHILDLQAKLQTIRSDQKRLAAELQENAAILAQEQALEKATRRVRLQEQQLELEKRQARLDKIHEHKSRQQERENLLREHEQLLHQQDELQAHLERIQTRLGKLPNRQPEGILSLRTAVGSN